MLLVKKYSDITKNEILEYINDKDREEVYKNLNLESL